MKPTKNKSTKTKRLIKEFQKNTIENYRIGDIGYCLYHQFDGKIHYEK